MVCIASFYIWVNFRQSGTSNTTYWLVTVDLPSKQRETVSHEIKLSRALAGANANVRGHGFALLLIHPLRQNWAWILVRLFPIVLKHLALCMKIKDRNSCLRVILAIYPPWRGILKCFLCRGWGWIISERVAQQRKIGGGVQLWRSCFPTVMPVVPHCSYLFSTVRAWVQIKKNAGKKGKITV